MKTNRILIGFTVLILAALACQFGSAPITSSQTSTPQVPLTQQAPLQVQAPNNPAAQQDALVALYQQTIPGVVTIQVTSRKGAHWAPVLFTTPRVTS